MRSSVVWVPYKKHFMEVRRGLQTHFTAEERRYWLSLEDWVAARAQAAPPVVETTPASSATPPVVAFDDKTIRADFTDMQAWIDKQTADTHIFAAGIAQMTTWLLETTAEGTAARDWLMKTPTWRYSVRAIVQAYGWRSTHVEAKAAVDAFLAKF